MDSIFAKQKHFVIV